MAAVPQTIQGLYAYSPSYCSSGESVLSPPFFSSSWVSSNNGVSGSSQSIRRNLNLKFHQACQVMVPGKFFFIFSKVL